jgi:hypothetical protein
MSDLTPDPSEADATDLTPDPVDLFVIDESRVETEETTNIVDEHDDVEVDENQSTEANPGLYPDDEDEQSALQVLHQEGDTTLIGHPDGVRLYGYDQSDGAE